MGPASRVGGNSDHFYLLGAHQDNVAAGTHNCRTHHHSRNLF